MALIGTIRNNGWILITLMVLALGGFIIMDIVSNSQNYSANDANIAGKAAGATIERKEMDAAADLFAGRSQDAFQSSQQGWNFLVEKAIIEKEAKAAGLGVPKDEMVELLFGNSVGAGISQFVQQAFTDSRTGQFNAENLQNAKQAYETGQGVNPQFQSFFSTLQKQVKKERLQAKLFSMVYKGIYTPTWQAEMAAKESGERADFLFVKVPFEKIADADAVPTDADFAAYFDEYKEAFRSTEETRMADFYAFDVVATAADSAACREQVSKLVSNFQTAANDSAFCAVNSGYYSKEQYFKKDQLGSSADLLLSAPIGQVVGPYFNNEGRDYRIAKVLGRTIVPDSAKCRHILISAKTPAEFPAASRKIDSLKNLIETGRGTFDALAKTFSEDPGSKDKGGVYEYRAPGGYVAPFEAVVFYTGQMGKLYAVRTQFGVHLIEVLGRKGGKDAAVAIAFLASPLAPSEGTQAAAKEKAIQLLQKAKTADQLKAELKAMGATTVSTPPMKNGEYSQQLVGALGTPETANEINRWLFKKETKEGSVSSEVFSVTDRQTQAYFDAKYLVAAVKTIAPKGLPKWQDVKPQLEIPVKNRKKAQVIASKIGSTSDLNAVAGMWQTAVDTAKSVSFSAQSIAKLSTGGAEYKVNGTMAALDAGQVSKPIEGQQGVYMIQVLSKTPAPEIKDMAMQKKMSANQLAYAANRGLMAALKKHATVDDNRNPIK